MIFPLLLTFVSGVVAQSCTVGQFKCLNDRESPEFTSCGEGGILYNQTCGEGTVCRQEGDSVYCGWPRGTFVDHFLAELSLLSLQLSELSEFPQPTESPEIASQVSSLMSQIEDSIGEVKQRIENDLGEPVGTGAVQEELSTLTAETPDLPSDIETIEDITDITDLSDVTNTEVLTESEFSEELEDLTSELSQVARKASVILKPHDDVIQTTDYTKLVKDQALIEKEIRFVKEASRIASLVSDELKKPNGKHDANVIRSLVKEIRALSAMDVGNN
ncbi:hypothetical protein BB560_001337 [Smittium megazygosporum]|uniref:Chitin-binding type-2 domain-containing protein n=1 Tax=Smittium megazygosporum TaxID=133381 RepID=A0A2T9ZHW3_9FUNG|nr:hypothetical protein BB560_001337 [Smittium megazygosporum]